MPEQRQTVSGIEIGEDAAEVAENVAKVIRETAPSIPFGTEPLDFLLMLERLAEDEEDRS